MRDQMLRIQPRAFDSVFLEVGGGRLQDLEDSHRRRDYSLLGLLPAGDHLRPKPSPNRRGLFLPEPTIVQMELLAVVAIALMSVIGWVVATECLGKWIRHDTRIYFAPAIGMAACAMVA